MPWWAEPEEYGSRHGCLSLCVCVCVCVILLRTFLGNHKELSTKVTMQLQLDILTPLNWLDFCLKPLLSSYSVMYSP